MLAGLHLDQLSGHTDAVIGFAQAAFEHIAHTQLPPDLLHIDCPPLEGKGRVAGDDEQGRIARQSSDHVLGNTVGEELLLGVARPIGKRQYCDRRLVGQC